MDKINIAEYRYINTNHYCYYIGSDFFTYYSFFKNEIIPPRPFLINSQNFTPIESVSIIKNLKIQFSTYQGECLLDKKDQRKLEDFQQVTRDFIPPNTVFFNREQFYSAECCELALDLSNKLFNLHSGLIK